ncbi:MAG: hypothetical protein QNJ11_15725 [Woeseiaceae bacterium]|nr:hypothetical protein [Woeseiaceae bacterium]
MRKFRLIAVVFGSALVAACGGNDTIVVDCGDEFEHQDRVEGKRIEVPDGLDPLDEFAEMPIPRADPNAPQTPDGRCVDMPPPIGSGS